MKNKRIVGLLFLIVILLFLFGFIFKAKTIAIAIFSGYKDYITEDSSALDYVKAEITSIESGINESVLGKYQLINLNGAFQKFLGKNVVNDVDNTKTVIKMKNGHLTFVYPKIDTKPFAENIVTLDKYLKERNSSVLYIQAPFKVSKYDNELPTGVEDYTNYNADEFLGELEKNGVSYLDLREEIEKSNLDYDSLFFRTDHHWTPETGFWAFTKIAEALKNKCNLTYNEKYINIGNYNKKVYKDQFLGSKGRRVGITYSEGLDDISLIYPKFETNLTVSVPSENVKKNGKFEDVVFEKEYLKKKNYYLDSVYCTYTGYDRSLQIFKNNNSENDKRILIIKDSFGRVVTPFLSLVCNEIDSIDLRQFDNNQLINYIDETDPDIVLFLYNSDIYRSDMKEMFDFGL